MNKNYFIHMHMARGEVIIHWSRTPVKQMNLYLKYREALKFGQYIISEYFVTGMLSLYMEENEESERLAGELME